MTHAGAGADVYAGTVCGAGGAGTGVVPARCAAAPEGSVVCGAGTASYFGNGSFVVVLPIRKRKKAHNKSLLRIEISQNQAKSYG